MKVDSHLHVNFKGLGADDLVARLDRGGIDLAWVLTWEERTPTRHDYEHLAVEDVLAAADRHPDRIVPMYAPDPAAPDAAERLEELAARGIRGCAEMKTTLRWDDPRFDPVLATAERLRLPLVFHMERGGDYYHTRSDAALERLAVKLLNSRKLFGAPAWLAERLTDVLPGGRSLKERAHFRFPGYVLDFAALELRLREFSDLVFVGHGPLFWEAISEDWEERHAFFPDTPVVGDGVSKRLLREYDNLYADLSGNSGYCAITRDRPHARALLEEFRAKLLFGTDNFELSLADEIDGLGLSDDAARKIYGENAARLLAESAT